MLSLRWAAGTLAVDLTDHLWLLMVLSFNAKSSSVKWGIPQNGWFVMDNPIKCMMWGYPYFRKPPDTRSKSKSEESSTCLSEENCPSTLLLGRFMNSLMTRCDQRRQFWNVKLPAIEWWLKKRQIHVGYKSITCEKFSLDLRSQKHERHLWHFF